MATPPRVLLRANLSSPATNRADSDFAKLHDSRCWILVGQLGVRWWCWGVLVANGFAFDRKFWARRRWRAQNQKRSNLNDKFALHFGFLKAETLQQTDNQNSWTSSPRHQLQWPHSRIQCQGETLERRLASSVQLCTVRSRWLAFMVKSRGEDSLHEFRAQALGHDLQGFRKALEIGVSRCHRATFRSVQRTASSIRQRRGWRFRKCWICLRNCRVTS